MNIIVQALAGAAIAATLVTTAVTQARPDTGPGAQKQWALYMDDLSPGSDGVPFVWSHQGRVGLFDSKDNCEEFKDSDFGRAMTARIQEALGADKLGPPTCRVWNPERKT